MNTVLAAESEEALVAADTPHLSFSRVNKYLTCPEQYRLYYLEGLRPRFASANLAFGQIVHLALAHLLKTGGDPGALFAERWAEMKELDLAYGRNDSWEKLQQSGVGLLERFVREELPRLEAVEASEKAFSLDITSLDLPFVGVIDLIGTIGGKRTLVDFKTSAKAYDKHEVAMSDQLTAYALAEPDAEQVALWVLVKTKAPDIKLYRGKRAPEALTEYLDKVTLVGREIAAGRFYKRPGMWCSWCDFLPACLRDHAKVQETLIQAL